MTFGRNKCDKRTAKNLKTRISRDQVDKKTEQLQLSKSIPNA